MICLLIIYYVIFYLTSHNNNVECLNNNIIDDINYINITSPLQAFGELAQIQSLQSNNSVYLYNEIKSADPGINWLIK